MILFTSIITSIPPLTASGTNSDENQVGSHHPRDTILSEGEANYKARWEELQIATWLKSV